MSLKEKYPETGRRETSTTVLKASRQKHRQQREEWLAAITDGKLATSQRTEG